ncbi:MAG: hypothetical protein ABEJ98_01665 [Candidatus Nanohaloarchaea archaeon]
MGKGALLFKPGTLILMFFIAVFGLVVFNWASDSVTDSVDSSTRKGTQAIKCSDLKMEVVDTISAENSTELVFVVNKKLKSVYVIAKSSSGANVTEKVENPSPGDLNLVNVSLSDVESVSLRTPLCDTALE